MQTQSLSQTKSLTTAKSAKDYLSKNEIPQLFECLMTGLMYHRPVDHIEYMQECLERIKKQGISAVRWDMFLEAKKTPLPPIASLPKEDFRPQPLPEIGAYQLKIPLDATIVVFQSGPGMDKADFCKEICSNFPMFCNVTLGAVLRDRALQESRNTVSKWKTVFDSINAGEMAPEEFVIETLVSELNRYDTRTHFLISGFPRTMFQKDTLESLIGLTRLRFMLLVDSEEDICRQHLIERPSAAGWNDHQDAAIQTRLANYKNNTLAVCKHFDEMKKLRMVDGDRLRRDVINEVIQVFSGEFTNADAVARTMSPQPPAQPTRATTEIKELVGVSAEGQRSNNLSQGTFILLLGGPGSGKTEVASQLCANHDNFVHFDLNALLRSKVIENDTPSFATLKDNNRDIVESWEVDITSLKEELQSVITSDGTIVIIEGYPKNKNQLDVLNSQIGQINGIILLDSEENEMLNRLDGRYQRTRNEGDSKSNAELRMNYFKENGLSICRYYDERSRLNIVPSDRDLLYVIDDFEKVLASILQTNNSAFELKEEETNQNEDVPSDAMNDSIDLGYDEPQDVKDNHFDVIEENGEVTRMDDDRVSETEEDRSEIKVEDESVADNTEVDESQIEEKDVKTEEEQEVKAEEEQDVKAEEEEDVKAEEEEDVKAEEEQVVKAEEEQDVQAEEEQDVKAEEEQDVKAEEEQDVKLSEEVDTSETNINYENENNDNTVEVDETVTAEHAMLLGDRGVRTNSQMELDNANIVLLIGGPGSGKKTYGDHLVSKYAISFIHVDQLINNEINSNPEEAAELGVYFEQGDQDFTPVTKFLRKALMNSYGVSKTIFVAAFPKCLEHYYLFRSEIAEPAAFLYIDVDDETIRTRLESESDHDSDVNIYNRIQTFNTSIHPLLEEIGSKDTYHKVDGSGTLDEVLARLSDIVDNLPFMQTTE